MATLIVRFQSALVPKDERYKHKGGTTVTVKLFQSALVPKDERYLLHRKRHALDASVSIRSRP